MTSGLTFMSRLVYHGAKAQIWENDPHGALNAVQEESRSSGLVHRQPMQPGYQHRQEV